MEKSEELRCTGCRKLLALIKKKCELELKCPRCKEINKILLEALEARKQEVSRDEKTGFR